MLELQVRGDKIFSERVAQHRAGFEGAQGVEQIERQAFDVSGFVGLGVHVDVEASARIALVADAVDHVAPESVGGALMRLYELTVGLVIAARASALPITPPMKL